MALSYPGEVSPIADHPSVDSFLVALNDRDLELEVRYEAPANSDEALRLAQRYEVSKLITDVSAADVRSKRYATRQVMGVFQDDSSSTFDTGLVTDAAVSGERQQVPVKPSSSDTYQMHAKAGSGHLHLPNPPRTSGRLKRMSPTERLVDVTGPSQMLRRHNKNFGEKLVGGSQGGITASTVPG